MKTKAKEIKVIYAEVKPVTAKRLEELAAHYELPKNSALALAIAYLHSQRPKIELVGKKK